MQLEDVLAPGALMQAVDVLRDEKERVDMLLDLGDGVVSSVRRDLGCLRGALGVPAPRLGLIAAIAVRVGEVPHVDFPPERVRRRAKGGHAALGRDARAGEDDDASCVAQHCRDGADRHTAARQ